ncbi:MAG: ABC transporter substrate-binding protein [Synechococcales cyanobacterium]
MGTYHFQVVAADAQGNTGQQTYALVIADRDAASPEAVPNSPVDGVVRSGSLMLPPDLPPGQVGIPYRVPLVVMGGTAPYQVTVEGLLPQVRALDERRVEFILPEPFAPFLIQAGASLMPKHVLEESIRQTDDKGDPLFLKTWGIDTPPTQLVGAGPYTMREYVPGQRLVYDVNPYYWKAGLPRIGRVIVRIVDSQETSLLQFRSRETDVYAVRGSDFPLLKREEDRDQFTIYELGATLDNNFIMLNQTVARDPQTNQPFVDPRKSRWFTDRRFRQAIAYALDRQMMVNSVLRGLGEIQHSPISPSSPFHLSPQQGLPIYNYDPARARQVLQDAGYRYDSDNRLRDPDNNLVRFTLNTNAGNSLREATGSLIQANLDQIGITVDFNPIAFNTLVQKFDRREWDAILLSFGGGGTEPNNGSNVWRSDGRLHAWNLGSQSSNPAAGVVVTDWEREIDQLFVAGVREQDLEKRRAYYNRFQQIVQEQLPLIGTMNPLVLTAMRNRLGGRDPRPIVGSLWNLDELILE